MFLRLLFVLLLMAKATSISFSGGSGEKPFKVSPPHATDNPLDKIVQSLVGDGVVVQRYRVNHSKGNALGTFEDASGLLGMRQGVMLTTGSIFNAVGPNKSGKSTTSTYTGSDSLLEDILNNEADTYDACILEMEVTAIADTLAFNFSFGSEEYDEYVGSAFNDIFAFFISGPGIEGYRNMALIPYAEEPVSINNVNRGFKSIPAKNQAFFIPNDDVYSPLGYDGYTKLIEVKQAVVPAEKYRLRLSIADVSDRLLDSGVMIEGKSLISYFKSCLVLFESDRFELKEAFKKELDDMVAKVVETGCNKIEVTAHTDSEGGNNYNLVLSENRMYAVVNYLVAKGIEPGNIIAFSRGESMPIASNETAQGRQRNRRVEVKLLGSVASPIATAGK